MTIYQKIDLICERLEAYKLHNPNSAIISYSGGRDSHLLLHIVRNVLKYNNEQYPAVYAETYNEYADIRHRIEEQDITIVDSKQRIFKTFKEEGLPLWGKQFSKYWNDLNIKKWNVKITNEKMLKDYSSRCDWVNSCGLCLSDKCCKLLKEDVLKGNKANIVGLRIAEKGRRSTGKNKEYDFCVRNSKVLFKPIFDVSNSELAEMEKVLGIINPDIYSFLDRTGCVMCGFGTKKQIKEKINYLRWFEPQRAKFYMSYFNSYLKYRKIL